LIEMSAALEALHKAQPDAKCVCGKYGLDTGCDDECLAEMAVALANSTPGLTPLGEPRVHHA
jgi:hypothetical protein